MSLPLINILILSHQICNKNEYLISFVNGFFEIISDNVCGNNLLKGWPTNSKNIDFETNSDVVLIDLIIM